MTDSSITEVGPCLSKTGLDTQKTGKKLVVPSVNEPETAVKAVPPTPTVVPEMESHTLSPEAGSFLPSPTLTTTPETATQITSKVGVNDAILPTTQSSTQKPESDELVLSSTTDNPPCSVGKKLNPTAERRKALMQSIKKDESQMTMYQIQLENYRPHMDRVKASLDIWGSGSPNEYVTRNKQIAAACQVSGLNDPNATATHRLAIATALHKGCEAYDTAFQQGLDRTDFKKLYGQAIQKAAEFFGLGNKQSVKAREKAKRKVA